MGVSLEQLTSNMALSQQGIIEVEEHTAFVNQYSVQYSGLVYILPTSRNHAEQPTKERRYLHAQNRKADSPTSWVGVVARVYPIRARIYVFGQPHFPDPVHGHAPQASGTPRVARARGATIQRTGRCLPCWSSIWRVTNLRYP